VKLFCDQEKRNRHNKFKKQKIKKINKNVHSRTTHDLATQLTVATLALPYWRRVGRFPKL
jgi:hypothetical protein